MAHQGRTILIIVLLAVALGILGLVLATWAVRGFEIEDVGREAVLELDFSRAFPEHRPEEALNLGFLPQPITLRQVVDALHRAADDDSIVGLVARIGSPASGLARLQEIRDAVAAFREGGKPSVAFAETFGEWGPGNGAYYLATAFEEIVLQPSGDLGLVGLSFEVPFLRGAVDKLGLVPRMDHRHEYKNAMNSYTEKAFTEPHREALQALADSQWDQMVRGIASGRGLTEERVRALVDGGPYLAAEALQAGLVDWLGYRDEVEERLEGLTESGIELEPLEHYVRRSRPMLPAGREVALIYGVGAVARGSSGFDPLTGSYVMGSDTVAEAFRTAIDDPDIEAILFRVDSPGGSYVASDTIWRETVRAREAGKPVIVSMGDVAGSGGYFVAMAADAIVAQPGTITGSIGVYGGKFVSRETWGKIGVSFDSVATGERAGMWSGVSDFSPEEWERLQDSLDRIYEDFTAKVASGRGLELETVGQIARGRIWTGEDALERGLVDELGGYPTALASVRRAIGAGERAPLRLRVLPRPRSPFEVLRERAGWAGEALAMLESGLRLLAAARPLVERAGRLGLLEPLPEPLLVPLWALPPAGARGPASGPPR